MNTGWPGVSQGIAGRVFFLFPRGIRAGPLFQVDCWFGEHGPFRTSEIQVVRGRFASNTSFLTGAGRLSVALVFFPLRPQG